MATEAVARIYQAGYRYSKAEVLLDLRQPGSSATICSRRASRWRAAG
jgi:hypothetical protein